jgi:hypothetical protein
MSVSKLSMAEGLILLHLHSGMDGDVIVIYSHGHITLCKITARPYGLVR